MKTNRAKPDHATLFFHPPFHRSFRSTLALQFNSIPFHSNPLHSIFHSIHLLLVLFFNRFDGSLSLRFLSMSVESVSKSSISNRNGRTNDHHIIVRISERINGDARRCHHAAVLYSELGITVGEDLPDLVEFKTGPVFRWDGEKNIEFQAGVSARHQPVNGWDRIELNGVPTSTD